MRDGEIAYLAFTEKGRALAERLRESLGGETDCTRDGAALADWTAERFATARALVYVGAAGIAVRAVAPHLAGKASDPAVVCVDEGGHYAIPLVSGHLGGANALAREIARVLGAEAVVTTATDVNGVFAVDEWARVQRMAVADPKRIKTVSAKLLAGGTIAVRSSFPIGGEPPEGMELRGEGDADVWVDIRSHDALTLVPRCLVLGVGCRRGTAPETLERGLAAFCEAEGVSAAAICAAATIDLKEDESGLLAFCDAHGWPISFYGADDLRNVPGEFTSSERVLRHVGVDNVCERAAVLASGGALAARKYSGHGVTFALAKRAVSLDWRWRDG